MLVLWIVLIPESLFFDQMNIIYHMTEKHDISPN